MLSPRRAILGFLGPQYIGQGSIGLLTGVQNEGEQMKICNNLKGGPVRLLAGGSLVLLRIWMDEFGYCRSLGPAR